ncbi:uncharacterized protein LOC115926045 [Strongylocentrotus purpuratus]|uniref:YqaJ viral recombinase domain-containing protein n=1 Tax=Strongylocentrotus purpuratus TaxID=7668 RepID=A0A7M7P6Z2_STRPU|nr:uncharacterized protein LOC115926045 [Strongylocentrotus purpuratus]
MRYRGNRRRANPWSLAGRIIGNGRSLKYLPSIARGYEMEPVARAKYAEYQRIKGHQDVDVKEYMFFHPRKSFLEASPDGLVSCSCCGGGLVEIKCPSTAPTEKPSPRNEKFLRRDNGGKFHLKRNHPYYDQIQAQLAVTGRSWCDFFVYKDSGVFLERIERDPQWQGSFVMDMDRFFWRFIVPVLVSRAFKNNQGAVHQPYGCPYCGEPSHRVPFCWYWFPLRCRNCKQLGHNVTVFTKCPKSVLAYRNKF